MPFQKAIEILNQWESRKLCNLIYKDQEGNKCAISVLIPGIEELAQIQYCDDLKKDVADPIWKLSDIPEVKQRLEKLEMSWLEAEELQKFNDFNCENYAPELRYTTVMQWLISQQTKIDLGTRSSSYM